MRQEYRVVSAICRKPLNRRSQRAKGDLFNKHHGACWGKPSVLTQPRRVSVTQLDSSSLQQTVQYLLDSHKALGMSQGPRVGMALSPTWSLLGHRLGMRLRMRLGMQEF